MEAKMLRCTAGVTRIDRIRNYVIRQKFRVAPIADKMREARLMAFDKVPAEKLLFKLKATVIHPMNVDWMKSFLVRRDDVKIYKEDDKPENSSEVQAASDFIAKWAEDWELLLTIAKSQ
ncbi:unnamed protein product [Heligmosomoides polygyrus]|uniref:HTH CENPB-type domain-containing protein n=1 Tax=Heligmosomoides polygyrus TaxID=6339 RepID=A0A183G517_HELPZ|nr:unnamed protein product [Heligmosomoides polygyrus]